MELKLKRTTYTDKSTIGQLFINGVLFCSTLEDVSRDKNKDGDLDDVGENKVHGKTAIPSGKYEVILNVSNRFKSLMPLLLNVKGFEGIRIHNGNTAEHTDGCILVGEKSTTKDFIGNSKVTFAKLMKVLTAVKKEKIYITIID